MNVGRAPAEQMKQPEGRFINNTAALIWLKQECMLTDRGAAGGGRLCSPPFCSVLEQNDKSQPAPGPLLCS